MKRNRITLCKGRDQNGLFMGRSRVRYGYSCYGLTRGNGTVWHYRSDDEGFDSKEIFMPTYYNSDDYA